MNQSPTKIIHSDFWLDDAHFGEHIEGKKSKDAPDSIGFTMDLIRLAAFRRVISNFVCILTNKDIPVKFLGPKNDSFTDGKSVWLSSSLRRKEDFDWTVGLALHEAAHIKLSDFEVLKSAFTRTPPAIPTKLVTKAKEKNITPDRLLFLCKFVFNVVEDRYIDSYIFSESPGYRGYYEAMYNRMWNGEDISKGLKSDMFRVPNIRSYEFRIVNLTNPDTEMNALAGLDEIIRLVDLENILRLQTTKDRLNLAYQIVEIILTNLAISAKEIQPQAKQTIEAVDKLIQQHTNAGGTATKGPKKKTDEESEDGEPEPSSGADGEGNASDGEGEDEPEEGSGEPDEPDDLDSVVKDAIDKSKGKESEDEPIDHDDSGDTEGLTKDEIKDITKEFEKQSQMLKHDFSDVKESVSESDARLLDVIEQHGIVLVPIGCDMESTDDIGSAKADCIVVQKLNMELISAGRSVFPMASIEKCPGMNFEVQKPYEEAVIKGFQLGRILGKRLQVRGETNVTKFIRKVSGKIERRLLSGIGAGLTDIFNRSLVRKYNKTRLHISVDASGSMAHELKWLPTMTCVTAICVAASMTENLSVSVSFRCTHNVGGLDLPYVVLAYDSSVDKISKVRQLFPYLGPNGGTPEGLAFEAIMKKFIVGSKTDNQEHYFVNISDGEPCYMLFDRSGRYSPMTYTGQAGTEHTKKQVDKIRNQGVKVLSYFIQTPGEISGANLKKQFERMYGKDAKFINVTSVFDIAKTMNRLFLTGVKENLS